MQPDSADLEEGLSSDAIDQFLADDDDDEDILESALVADTTPLDAPASDPDSDPAPDSPASSTESDATKASASSEAPADTAPTETIPPVEVGKPFTFRVDGTDITPEGALVYADHIRIPTAVWDQEIRPKWLANRNSWREREAGYQQQLTQATTAKSDKEYRADALIQRVEGLLGNEDALLEFIGNFQQNAPVLRAQAEAAALKAQLDSRQAEDQTRETTARAEQLRPQLQQYLGGQLEAMLAEEPYKILGANKEEAVKFLQQLWSKHAGSLYYEDAQGQIGFNHEALRELVHDKAGQLQAVKDAVAAATKVARENAKAVAPTAGKPALKAPAHKPGTKAGPKKRMTADEFEERWENIDLTAD